MINMYEDIDRILCSKEDIAKRVKEIAKQLDEEYKDSVPLLVCVLKGSVMFFSDLIREMKIPVNLDFISISSYGSGTKSSGEVKFLKDLDSRIEGRDVIIVEDILDTGYTLTYLKRTLMSRQPKSLKLCCLLDKPSRREVDIYPDYCGFAVENLFVVGYGLDYNQKYRNLPEIGVLKPSVYENN